MCRRTGLHREWRGLEHAQRPDADVGLVIADVVEPLVRPARWRGRERTWSGSASASSSPTPTTASSVSSRRYGRCCEKQVDALIVASSSADGAHLRAACDAARPSCSSTPSCRTWTSIRSPSTTRLRRAWRSNTSWTMATAAWPSSTGDRACFGPGSAARAMRSRSRDGPRGSAGVRQHRGGHLRRADARRWLGCWRLPTRPSAILATNNLMTVGALVAIAEAGLGVPARHLDRGHRRHGVVPYRQPSHHRRVAARRGLGREAAERLLLRLRRQRQPRTEHIKLDFELRVRSSVGPPPSSAQVSSPTDGGPASHLAPQWRRTHRQGDLPDTTAGTYRSRDAHVGPNTP